MCAEARRCDSATCTKWRWKETADAKGETKCLCGRPFTRTEWRRLGERKAEAKAKAQPKKQAAAKAKAKAQGAGSGAGPRNQGQAPWSKPKGGTKSSTTQPLATYELSPELAARAATDDVVLAEEHLRWCRMVGRSEQIQEAEKVLRKARETRDEALPPRDRLSRLRAQRDEAEKELAEKERAVEETQENIYDLECRLHHERDEVVGVQARLETLDHVIEQVELQIPPDAGEKEGGVAPMALTQLLMHVQRSLIQLQGGDLPADVHANMQTCLRVLDSYGMALDRSRREREAQVASDARLAKALAEKEAQERATVEDEDVDVTGEGDYIGVQSRGKAKKGKGLGKGWTREGMASPTEQQSGSGPDIGPLATLGRVPPIPPPPSGERP